MPHNQLTPGSAELTSQYEALPSVETVPTDQPVVVTSPDLNPLPSEPVVTSRQELRRPAEVFDFMTATGDLLENLRSRYAA